MQTMTAEDLIDLSFITLKQAADLCGLAPVSLRTAAFRDRLRTIKPGRDHLTTRAWLEDYLATRPDWVRQAR